jgi:putative transposase
MSDQVPAVTGKKFRPDYARRLRRKQPSPHDLWHLDEVVINIAGKKHWLWRAVDQDGYVLDEIVQSRRNYQGRKTRADPALEEAGYRTQAHDHRQTATLWGSQTPSHAGRRAPIAQGFKHSCGELASTASKARTSDADLPIPGWSAGFCLDLLRPKKSIRATPLKESRITNSRSPSASHGGMESCDGGACLKSVKGESLHLHQVEVTSPYLGKLVWNRCSYVKDPRTGKRVARPNRVSQWERMQVPDLRIISDDLWQATKRRQEIVTFAISPEWSARSLA